ncbi:MAG TPA: aldo/keto reductase [Bryobacteraceae bacterium]|jgi:aryl-alcohol dehydrogenase-like predicted oxidoreductase|nr:aldo/keto reductase [Bryobacteraceae bacterium]
MKYRPLGRTGFEVSEVSLGAWQIGGAWGAVPDEDALRVVRAALDCGINFIDTADVYGDGRSERLIAQALRDHPGRVFVATKAGRRLSPHTAAGYNRENLIKFIERSLRNLERDALDLVQLHCPPTEVYYLPEVFGILDELKRHGKILHYGVSVEKVEEALIAIEYPDVQTVQIIFNLFRQRPRQILFPLCRERRVGVLARLPLSSGLLSGKIRRDSQFAPDDHRSFNRNGEQFDKGETFSGIPLEAGLDAVEEIRKLMPDGVTMADFALRWILDEPAVSCVIPGARNEQQVRQNAAASDLPPLTKTQREAVNSIYERRIKMLVHHRW